MPDDKICTWIENDDGVWETKCDELFEFNAGGPHENGFAHCPYCGKNLNTAKIYKDSDNNDCSIYQMVRREPDWAASRIQVGEDALDTLTRIKAWDVAQYAENGKFSLPLELREKMQRIMQN